MLSILNYCRRNANQNDNKKSNPTSQNGQSQKSTNNICGREQGGMGNPQHGLQKEHWQQPLELTASAWQEKKKKSKRANPRI